MAEFRVRSAKPIACSVTVPGDARIAHHAVILAALASGTSRIDGFPAGGECQATLRALRALGVVIGPGDTPAPAGAESTGGRSLLVHGAGHGLTAPAAAIECGDCPTTLTLMSGLLAGQPFRSELTGSAALRRRPMRGLIEALSLLGARVTGQGAAGVPPLVIDGEPLLAPSQDLPGESEEIKGALLLAGLFCQGKLRLTAPRGTGDHTERMFEAFGIHWRREEECLVLPCGQRPEPRTLAVPGDLSNAAVWVVAAAAQPGSEIQIDHVGLNPTRSGFLKVLGRMGAQIQEIVETKGPGEPAGRLIVRGGSLRATTFGGAEWGQILDEVPVLAVAGALATGSTVVHGPANPDPEATALLASTAAVLRTLGATVREGPDGLHIDGPTRLRAPRQPVPCDGDPRIALAAAVAGLFADGVTVVSGAECVEARYPGFRRELERFQTEEVSSEIRVPVVAGVGGMRPQVVVKFDQPKTGVVIAIDGPAASGKSTVSRDLARVLDFVHVNSGAIYRAVTRAVLDAGIDPSDSAAVEKLIPRLRIECGQREGEGTVEINGALADGLSAPEVNAAVSAVARIPAVRSVLFPLQRRYAALANIVMEGRDIGSAIFPETPYKYYVDASPDVRARRRAAQGLADSVAERDRQDSTREVAPLRQAEGAMIIDSSDLSVEKVVARIVEDLRAKGLVV